MMSFSVCVVIPVYNHGDTVGETIATLKQFRLTCILIDDGSDSATQECLRVLAAQDQTICLIRLEVNQGKGGAVMAGLLRARELGFTHALQIDADGQHNTQDIPALLHAAELAPQGLISGQPRYDASAPTGRMLARRITHFWVGIETLSWQPPDTMCGFRVYPLMASCALIDRVRLGRRMDFDIEIVVRLMWRGVRVVPVETQVIYPPGGRSHFKYLRDNVLISWLHTRLFFGMLWRSPRLLLRKFCGASDVGLHWSEMRERGTVIGIQTLLWIYKMTGRLGYKLILLPVMAYYFLTGARARHASQEYLRRVYRAGSAHPAMAYAPSVVSSFRHFLSFGDAIIDRVASWSGGITRDDVVFESSDATQALALSGSGAVIISAHLGNIELARALADGVFATKMNALMFTEHAEKFNSVLRKVNPCILERVIHVNHIGPETAILLQEKIRQGEMLVILGDRTAVHSTGRVSSAVFLGDPALFSQGPFILAALLNCPVYLMFCLKRSRRYYVYFEHFSDRVALNRKTREQDLQQVIQRFAKRLEYYCCLEPLQWFNFYDFWRQSEENNH